MRILIYAYAFLPHLGGIETSADALARGFTALGHEVRLVTRTPNLDADAFPYRVYRRPGFFQMLRLVCWCQAVLHNHISLRAALPMLFCWRRWVIAHQTGLRRADGSLGALNCLKRALLPFARSVAISQAIAEDLPKVAAIIPNPYADHVFRDLHPASRPFDLAFLGRLVSDKGCGLLLEAIAKLGIEKGLYPRLLIIGRGPEEQILRTQASFLGLADSVEFAGPLSGEALVRRLNEARILVVPSLWNEPFGIVALEGIACGLAVVGSAGGGLPEAIGPCGLTFPNGDVPVLTARLAELLREPSRIAQLLAAAPAHLARHDPAAAAAAYLAVMDST
jgi:glycogen(starch) synthase